MRIIFQEEKGSVLIIMVLVIAVFVGITAVVVESGSVYWTKGKLQNAVNASALTGTQSLAKGGDWKKDAEDIAEANGLDLDKDQVIVTRGGLWYGNYTTIEVTASRALPYTLSKLLGGSTGQHDVTADAIAQVQVLTGMDGLIPVVALPGEISFGGDPILLKGGSKEKFASTGPGGFRGLLSLDGAHGSSIGGIFVNGCKQVITVDGPGSYIDTQNGNVSAIKSEVNQRIAKNPLVYVPVVETEMIEEVETVIVTGGQVHVIGFAAFMLEGVYEEGEDARLQGHFVEMLDLGDSSPAANYYGLKTVKLIK